MYKEKPEIKGCTQPCLPKRRLDKNGRHHFFVRVPAKTCYPNYYFCTCELSQARNGF